MRNVFLFIQRYFVFLSFLILQFVALWMLFTYNRFHRTVFLGVANELTGRINTQVDKVDDYFHLREENRKVHRMNDSLMNLLNRNFLFPDTTQIARIDTVAMDSTKGIRRYLWREAKVVYNTINFERNYLQLDRGADYGIKDNMAVLSSDGSLVGLVVSVSSHFSQAMSLLHIQNKIPATLKKIPNAGTIDGTIEWDSEDPRFVTLKGISRDVEVKKGDSVLTSTASYNFPPGYLIGTIASIKNDPATGFYLLTVKAAVNFSNLQQVFVVENIQREEQLKLDRETKLKVEQQKSGNR